MKAEVAGLVNPGLVAPTALMLFAGLMTTARRNHGTSSSGLSNTAYGGLQFKKIKWAPMTVKEELTLHWRDLLQQAIAKHVARNGPYIINWVTSGKKKGSTT
ncbi:hypothetical protein J6590_011181 [Homalodisca vitripennis]|nr:hypothetical protein J6590_011181 [Homalodisca vitripennis]